MLSRKNRFHGHNSVRRVYRQGQPVRVALATLHVLRNEKIRTSKVAVVVSRKVDKSAVKRNRIRRRIYELLRPEVAKLKIPTELVVTVYQVEAATMPAEQLAASVRELLKKANL